MCRRLLLALVLLVIQYECHALVKHLADPTTSRVWGPGVEYPDRAVLPARYFFIEPRNAENKRINESQVYQIQIEGFSRLGSCRHKINQIDRDDGSSIIRYTLIETCQNVVIHVLLRGVNLRGSPFRPSGSLYTEKCYCPQASVDEWLQAAECPDADPQIIQDLVPFRALNFSSLRQRVIQQYDKPNSVSLCNYAVKKNEIYRRCYGQYTGFKMFMDQILLSLARKFVLPDMELFVNLGDWPLVKKGGHSRTTGPFPIFSWCGSDDTFDIVMPTYDITESTLENMGRVSLDMLSVQRRTVPWADKIPKGFWRGRDSRRERLDLVDISRKFPDLVNASLTHFFFYRDEEAEYGPTVAIISFHKFFDYRYQINVDGTVAAYRLPYLLAGSSVLLKQESTYYEHFYRKLVQNKHYIPVKPDLSDLITQIEWARANDGRAQEIRDNANAFVNDNLLPQHIFCYHGLLFKEYAKNIVSTVQIPPEMEKLEQPTEAWNCQCEQERSPRDEL